MHTARQAVFTLCDGVSRSRLEIRVLTLEGPAQLFTVSLQVPGSPLPPSTEPPMACVWMSAGDPSQGPTTVTFHTFQVSKPPLTFPGPPQLLSVWVGLAKDPDQLLCASLPSADASPNTAVTQH